MSNFKLTKIIEKKRKCGILTGEDIEYFVDAVVKSTRENKCPSQAADRCQIGALLMAMYLNGLTSKETADLTEKMMNSGHVFHWPEDWKDTVVDKHSTGGVGDKVSLVLAPVLAALGLKVPMISGRSLLHTGGTLDKLESIPGVRVYFKANEIQKIVETVGCCIVGQTEDCNPADKVLYQCREITATVDSAPLIVASIVSKKLSEGLNAIVYDVKFGKGAIFKTKEEALEIAKQLVSASKTVKSSALLTAMDAPLGRTIGNSLEVMEAVESLRGNGPSDFLRVVIALGSEVLLLVNGTKKNEAEELISSALNDGKALRKFHDMIIAQGASRVEAEELCYGNINAALPKASYATEISYSGEEGYICEIDPLSLANVWKEEYSNSQGNPGIGIRIVKAIGERIKSATVQILVYGFVMTKILGNMDIHLMEKMSYYEFFIKRLFKMEVMFKK
ncbi:thymidine phosphorylase-like isoform X2 [Stegodyphus dumicola]|uniref:thymidine phosphorylase-like isoform X2 n=1 Tax=Stegodyphus dumicola TaxID=202533 RepID=UPI0015AC0B71|nr:thymidine phosphorylase-like isoform X2 [Stegodyphus dumicola]